MKIKQITSLFLGIFFSIIALGATLEDPPPLKMLRGTADNMISELTKNQGKLNDRIIYNVVKRVIMPRFDLYGMSRSVVGRDYWQQGSSSLQKQFTDEFTKYVIRTYSAALSSYSGEQIKFYPIRGYDPSQNTVQIESDILQQNGPPIPVSYRLLQNGSSWIIYDFSVEGISLVQNYRSQFANTLQQSGLAGLVKEIHQRNDES